MLHNRYQLKSQLGSGAFGTVFRAEDTQLANKQVAVKRIDGQASQEMALLAHLDHPNIPAVQDFFEEHNCSYLVMKYIAGQTLADLVASSGPRQLDEVIQIGLVLCDVLDYLHSQNPPIIFRDLKPENVIRTPSGHISVVDFGIARHFKPGQAKDTYAIGSVGYAPPEQHNRAQTDARTDVYALGALLYYLATGDNPSAHPFRFDYSLVLPSSLRIVLERATELTPDRRHDSAQTLANELRICQQPAPAQIATATSPARSILWVYALEDAHIVKRLEVQLALLRRENKVSFLHNNVEHTWPDALRQSLLIGVFHSPYLYANDELLAAWENVVYPDANAVGMTVVPLIARAYGKPQDFYPEPFFPRYGDVLNGANDAMYDEAGRDIKKVVLAKL